MKTYTRLHQLVDERGHRDRCTAGVRRPRGAVLGAEQKDRTDAVEPQQQKSERSRECAVNVEKVYVNDVLRKTRIARRAIAARRW